MKNFPEGPFPAFSIGQLLHQWQTQRLRPEHRGESSAVFYSWRILTVLCAVIGFIFGGFGIPIIITILLAPRVPPFLNTSPPVRECLVND